MYEEGKFTRAAAWAGMWAVLLVIGASVNFPFIRSQTVATGTAALVVTSFAVVVFGAELRAVLRWLGSKRPGSATSPAITTLGRGGLNRLIVGVLPVVALVVVVADAVWRNPTEAAAVATALTIGYIAYQSWQTRRAADAAERGLETAERSMETTERSLQVSQVMAAEAEKTRLDQRQLTIRVNLSDPQWPPGGARQHGSDPKPFTEGHIFRLPKNANDMVTLRAEGEVINEGSTTVEVELRNLCLQQERPNLSRWTLPTTKRQQLPPGGKVCFCMEAQQPVSEWVANAKAWGERARPYPHVTRAEIVVDDDFDNGVIDTWPLKLSGAPLEPVPDEAESWQIYIVFDDLPIKMKREPRQRTYWRSKLQEVELPTLEA